METLADQCSIQKFEYCIDLLWKLCKSYLDKLYDVKENIPSLVSKSLFKANITSEEETEQILEIIKQRNLTSHMYHKDLAKNLDDYLEGYFKIINDVSERLKEKIDSK